MLVAWVWLAPAAMAQPGRSENGYIGRGAGTEEVDTCRRPEGLDEAEAETRAYEHYERGSNLYEQGDYRAAIDEFVLAYCHKPLASVLKDIAQSYERLVDYEKSVAYLERYILESPEDRNEDRRVQSARAQVLRNLPARVRIATEPPGASVTLTSKSGARGAHGFSNADEPLEIRKGTYVLTVSLPGHETVTETIEVKIGQPYSYYFRLEPKKGTLRVAAQPASARVFVGDRWVALGNYVDTLPIGKYTVSVEADDHLPEKREVEITGNDQVEVSVKLDKLPRSGRFDLLVAATVGGALMGSSVASLFSTETRTLGGAVPVGLGLGFGGAYLGVPDDIPVGTSSYVIGATVIGSLEGYLIASYLAPCNEDVTEESIEECKPVIASSLAGSVSGLLFGAFTAGRFELDAGDAALINSGALWGIISGSLFYVAFGEDPTITEPLLFGGLNIGLVTGSILAQRAEVSRGHVALIDVSGFLGLLVGGAVADVADQDEGISERVPHFALVGMTVGLITGTYLTRNMDEPASLRMLSPNIGAARDTLGKSTMTMGVRWSF